MYENHWNLSDKPFENWRDSAVYYPSEIHQTAVLKIAYAVESGHSAIVVSGDPGIGKTFICDLVAEKLSSGDSVVSRMVFPQLPGNQLLAYFADKLSGKIGPNDEPPRVTLARIEAFIDQSNEASRRPVIIIDEAHTLDGADQIETLRLLLNLGQCPSKTESAWTLILSGQPGLMAAVSQNRALEERVATTCLLHRFSGDQTAAYLSHRLDIVGGDADRIFTSEALDTLHLRSLGIPRRINRLADLALMFGFAEDLIRIDSKHIDSLHQEIVDSVAS